MRRPDKRAQTSVEARPQPRAPWVRLAYACAVASLWAVALLFDPAARESFRLPKALAAELLALVSLLALALAGRFAPDRALARHPALRAALPLALAAALAALLSSHAAHVTRALPGLAVALATLVGWSAGFSAGRRRRLLEATVAPAVVLAAIGVLQFHGLFRPFGFAGPMLPRYETTSLAGNVGDLAAALVVPALLAQAALAAATSRRARILAGLKVALLLYAIGTSQTLAALAAVACGSLVLWGLLLPRRRMLQGAGALAATALLAVVLVGPLRSRVVEKATALAAGDLNQVLTGRLDGWRAALWMLGRHPATGVGPGAFAAEFVPAKLALLDEGVEFFPEQQQVVFANAHNEALEVGAETGLVGLGALLWALGQVFGAVKEKRGVDPRALAAAGVAALVVLSLAYFPFRVAVVGYPVLAFLAWTLGRDEVEEERPRASGRARLAAAALLAVALVGAALLARDRLDASRMLRSVEARTMQVLPAAGTPRGRAVLESNLRVLAEARRRDPAEVGVLVARGSQYLVLGRGEPAAAAYREALALEPRPETHLNLGRALKLLRRDDEAARELALALRLSPHLVREVGDGD